MRQMDAKRVSSGAALPEGELTSLDFTDAPDTIQDFPLGGAGVLKFYNIIPEIKSGPHVSVSRQDCEMIKTGAGGIWAWVEAGRCKGREGFGEGRVLNG
jgi:hypothetical protein